MSLTGIFISTVLYLYLLGTGLEVVANYAKRFDKKYGQREVPGRAGAILLLAYLVSVAKYLFVLGIMKKVMR